MKVLDKYQLFDAVQEELEKGCNNMVGKLKLYRLDILAF
jgi:hypothetical protein